MIPIDPAKLINHWTNLFPEIDNITNPPWRICCLYALLRKQGRTEKLKRGRLREGGGRMLRKIYKMSEKGGGKGVTIRLCWILSFILTTSPPPISPLDRFFLVRAHHSFSREHAQDVYKTANRINYTRPLFSSPLQFADFWASVTYRRTVVALPPAPLYT